MQRVKITPSLNTFPQEFHNLLKSAEIYDSSCSPEARVYFIDKDNGYYLKTAAKGTLQKEAELTAFFHTKNLGAKVCDYQSFEKDWLLTGRVRGEDCTHTQYLADPKRLCDTIAELLRSLHETDFTGCPVLNHTEKYLQTVMKEV